MIAYIIPRVVPKGRSDSDKKLATIASNLAEDFPARTVTMIAAV
jgi:hypothetical protein